MSCEEVCLYIAVGNEACKACMLYGHLLETGYIYALLLIKGNFNNHKLMCFVIVSASQILLTSLGQTCET
jgi:hypothetical protein